ncbi:MAG: lipid-A-disaccharide synthase [Patiriisocius sp.]
MKYYIIAGEASGDLHGANLIKSIKAKDPKASFRFWGGDLMQQQTNGLVKHYRDLAFMGFIEVLFNLRTIFKNISICKKDITSFQPDVIIFIDYPGFNLRIAKWAKKEGFKTHYYISPQIWAWKEGRIKDIKTDVDAMYVILPFEKDFYQDKHNYPVHFVGHPLIDAISDREPITLEAFAAAHRLDQRPIIALLPGSRKQEISKMLDVMLSITEDFANYQFVIAGAPSQEASFYAPFLHKQNVHLLLNKTYDLLSVSHAAIVTSGTATLETALFKVPQVVCYKANPISVAIARQVVKLKFISLVNLILDKEVVTELIQGDFNTQRLSEEVNKILNTDNRVSLLESYDDLEQKLGGIGASDTTGQFIVDAIK